MSGSCMVKALALQGSLAVFNNVLWVRLVRVEDHVFVMYLRSIVCGAVSGED